MQAGGEEPRAMHALQRCIVVVSQRQVVMCLDEEPHALGCVRPRFLVQTLLNPKPASLNPKPSTLSTPYIPKTLKLEIHNAPTPKL